jgi:hypothetical protein
MDYNKSNKLGIRVIPTFYIGKGLTESELSLSAFEPIEELLLPTLLFKSLLLK